MTGITCYDTAYNDQFPAGAAAYAAYVDGGIGSQPNYAHIVSAFPEAHHLSIALFPDRDADALDVETGAAQAADIPGWFARQAARGVRRPVIYAGAYNMRDQVIPVIEALPGARAAVRLWSAHYTGTPHICGPSSCGETPIDMDGTQWWDKALGRDLDISLLRDDFFGTVPPAHPSWMEKIMKALPVLRQGSADHAAVRRVQALVNAGRESRGLAPVAEDGVFGPVTANVVGQAQAEAKIARDEIVGPATWAVLLGVS